MPQVFDSGVSEVDLQEFASRLAFDVKPCATNWTEAATRAIVAVKREIVWGASNRPADLVPDWRMMVAAGVMTAGAGLLSAGLAHVIIDRLRAMESLRRNWRIDDRAAAWGQPDAGTDSPCEPARIQIAETLGYLAMKEGAGNCQYQASAVFLVLNAAGVTPVDLVYVFRRDHTPVHGLCIIGIPRRLPDPNFPDPAAWGTRAVLADPWQNELGEPASSLLKRYPPAGHIFQSYARNAPV